MTKIEQLKTITKAFIDSDDNSFYVSLPRTRLNYSKLVNSLNNPFKIILLYGEPGSGKSYLFNKFFNEHKDEFFLFVFKTPDFTINSLLDIYEKISNNRLTTKDNHKVLESFRDLNEDITIMLDEAQLYTTQEMEWIRLLSNEKNLKFIISVHKVDNEDILAQKHFQTRIYETIHFNKLDLKEVKLFIEEKLLQISGQNYIPHFSEKNIKIILSLTKGNLRDLNRLLHRTFSLLALKIEHESSFEVNKKEIEKYLEMAALDLKMKIRKNWMGQWI